MTARVLTRFYTDVARWPSFWPYVTPLNLEITKTNILGKIHDNFFKTLTSRVLTRSSFDLAWWPSFWLQVTQFQTWPRNHQEKHFEQDSWCLLHVTARVLTRFYIDVARWPSFWPYVTPLNLEITKTNILGKIHDNFFKTVTSRVLTRSSFDLAWWSSFWLLVTQFQTWPRNHQEKHFEQDSWCLLMWPPECCQGFTLMWPGDLVFDPTWPHNLELIKTNILDKIHDDCFKIVTSRVLTRSSFDLAWWPSFWIQVT